MCMCVHVCYCSVGGMCVCVIRSGEVVMYMNCYNLYVIGSRTDFRV